MERRSFLKKERKTFDAPARIAPSLLLFLSMAPYTACANL
jgi:hypothetical protein